MKNFFTLILNIVILGVNFAQNFPPDLNGEALRLWMKSSQYDEYYNLLGYTEARRNIYNYIDNRNGVITGVYSGYQVPLPYGGTETNPMPINCEHTIPQSFFNSEEPMMSDIHHLFPTYSNWNSTRGNNPFGDIDDNIVTKWMYMDTEQTQIPNQDIDSYSEFSHPYFEPREEHKGNVARAIFYFYTMYPTQAGPMSQIGDLNTFYQWHLQDPVDGWEELRNDDIEFYQGNRNPYIDEPGAVELAWGINQQQGIPVGSTNISLTLNAGNLTIDWNDVDAEVGYRLYRSGDNEIFELLADLGANTMTWNDTNIQEGKTFYYYVTPYNTNGNGAASLIESRFIDYTPNVSTSSELIISEYIEGGSYNKAIEIANFTGETIDLSNYELQKQTNGAGVPVSLSLNGILDDGQTFVVANDGSGTELLTIADVATSSSVFNFNGNDPILLAKNGTVIDAVGVLDGAGSYFAQDITLVRKSHITQPNIHYTLSEWDIYAKDTYEYLGSHSMDLVQVPEEPFVPLSGFDKPILNPKPYSHQLGLSPNPPKGGTILLTLRTENYNPTNMDLMVMNMMGQVMEQMHFGNETSIHHSLDISKYAKGIYFVKAIIGGEIQTQQLIIQ